MSSAVAAGARGLFEDGSEQAFIPAVRCSRLDVCARLSVPIYSVPEVIVADESIFGLLHCSLNLIGIEDYKAFLLGFQPQEHVKGKARGLRWDGEMWKPSRKATAGLGDGASQLLL